MFCFNPSSQPGTCWPMRERWSWPFMLSFRDGIRDAKDGVVTDRQSLLLSELGSLGSGNVTL